VELQGLGMTRILKNGGPMAHPHAPLTP
jgi:hypothetical protein